MGLGTLYPAYRSYKAIKSKDTKEYVSIESPDIGNCVIIVCVWLSLVELYI